MSKICFCYSNKLLPKREYLEFLEKSDFNFETYPYLKDKNFIYKVNYPMTTQSVFSFIELLENLHNGVQIGLVLLEETDNIEEIKLYNTLILNVKNIKINNKNENYYDFKYRLERGSFLPNTEYLIER